MALPNIFGTETVATGGQLDQNFSIVGLLGTIPCTVAGTNAVILTPQANTPTVSGYSNYTRFSGVISATNSGATTVAVGSLAALPVYKDTVSGPAALSGGEQVIGNVAVWTYDSALSPAGGFHVSSPSSGSGTGTVTSVGSGTGLTGGPITASGTLSLATIATLRLLANITGGTAAPVANSLTAIFDTIVGNTQGMIYARGASSWAAVTPGVAGSSLITTASGMGWGLIVSAITSAAGSNQGTAAALGLCNIAVLGTVGSGTGAILSATATSPVYVLNRGSNNLALYPNSGAQIEGLGVNAASTITATTGNGLYIPTAFSGANPTQWYRAI